MASTSTESPDTYTLDDQIGYLLRLANQRHTTIFQSLTRHGLTPTQLAALVRIAEQGTCSQNRLGRLAAMDVATIKGVVDRLRQKGLTEARPDPTDKRRMLISLSDQGKEIVTEMMDVGHDITRATLTPLTASEQRTLIRLLRKIT